MLTASVAGDSPHLPEGDIWPVWRHSLESRFITPDRFGKPGLAGVGGRVATRRELLLDNFRVPDPGAIGKPLAVLRK